MLLTLNNFKEYVIGFICYLRHEKKGKILRIEDAKVSLKGFSMALKMAIAREK